LCQLENKAPHIRKSTDKLLNNRESYPRTHTCTL